MKVYTNSPVNFFIEDKEVIETFDTYIFTRQAIYKKYKKHFFLCERDEHICFTKKQIGSVEYIIEDDNFKDNFQMNKQKILTSIPYQCYFVNRTIQKCTLENDIIYVKEIDNDNFETSYFIIDEHDKLNFIGLYLK